MLLGSIIARLVDVNTYFRLDDYEEAFLVYVCAAMFVWFILIIVFVVITWMYWSYMKELDRRDARDDGNY